MTSVLLSRGFFDELLQASSLGRGVQSERERQLDLQRRTLTMRLMSARLPDSKMQTEEKRGKTVRTKGKKLQRNNFALPEAPRGVEVECLYHPACRTFGSPYCRLASREIFSTCPLPATLTSTTVTPSRVSEP